MNTPTHRTPAECAQEQLDAYNARNIERFAAAYHPNVQLIDLASGEVFCNGIDALRSRYGVLFDSHPSLHCTLVSRIVCPPFVMDEEHVRGLLPDSVVHAVATYECNEGLITRAWFVREATI